jgi:hypothetical protein
VRLIATFDTREPRRGIPAQIEYHEHQLGRPGTDAILKDAVRQRERLAANACRDRADLDIARIVQFTPVIHRGRRQHHVELRPVRLETRRDELATRLLEEDRHRCIVHVAQRIEIVVANRYSAPGLEAAALGQLVA